MKKRLDKIPFVKVRSEDILISRMDDAEQLLSQLEVTYLGFRVNVDSVLPLPEKIELIKNVKRPSNVSELKSFLGKCFSSLRYK